ncbi:MAG: TIR domain-containing protein, partial [Anaerolineae bacterium]|nr:TIR domain-containing protein [Anaerolineae bacterium]
MTTYDVFLSYSRTDVEVMRRVAKLLRSHGARVWVDETLEIGSPNWQEIVEQAIADSRSVVAILSPEAKKSRWVMAELSNANLNDVTIFPLLIRGDIRDSVPLVLSSANWHDARQNLHAMTETFALDVCKQLGITSNVQLIREVKRLEHDLDTQRDTNHRLHQQITEKDNAIATLESRLRQQDHNIQKLMEQVYDLQRNNVSLEEQITELRRVAPEPGSVLAKFVERYKDPTASNDKNKIKVEDYPEWHVLYNTLTLTESQLEQTREMLALTRIVPELHPRSLMDWFVLLHWYFFRPVQIARHRLAYGEHSLDRVKSWLNSTLIWGALLIPLIGAVLRLVPIAEDFAIFGQTLASPVWILGALLAWFATGLFGNWDQSNLPNNVAFVIAGSVTGFTAFAILSGIPLDEPVALAFFVVVGVLFALAGLNAYLIAFVVTFILASSLTLGLPSVSILGTTLVGMLLASWVIAQLLGDHQQRKLVSFHTIFSA